MRRYGGEYGGEIGSLNGNKFIIHQPTPIMMSPEGAGEITDYRTTLLNAGVPEEDVERIMNLAKQQEREVPNHQAQQPSPEVRLSRKAARCVSDAQRLGINPLPYIKEAAVVAATAGKTKIGPFGKTVEIFNSLERSVEQMRSALNHPRYNEKRI